METVLSPTVTTLKDSIFPVIKDMAEKVINEAEVLQQCLSLDLNLVKGNAVKKFGWSTSKADETEYLYKRFLFLCYKHQGKLAPSDNIDAFWELHILDTKQYFNDCMSIFGFFLHHTPNYLYRNPTATREVLLMRFAETKALFALEFGDGMADAVMSGCDDCIPDYDPPK
jgi:hypothetical protein